MKIRKIQGYKNKKIIVMSPPTDPPNCPRLIVSENLSTSIKDDYSGKVRVSGKFLKRLCL